MFKRSDKYIWLIAFVCLFSLILFLGLPLFNTKGEPREAIVAMSMLHSGNWILPVHNGIDIAYKPPLLHWCIALLSLVGGEVTPFTSRLPSALSLTVMVIAGYCFHKRFAFRQTAFLSALITLTFFEVHRAGMACRVDMLLSSLIVISLYLLYLWIARGMRGVPLAAIVCMSGAVLAKGPVGLLLPCLTGFVFLVVRGNNVLRALPKFILIVAASCLLPLAWYVAAYMQGGDNFLRLVYEENVLRFVGKMSYSSHVKPVSYNFLTLLAGCLPYTLFVLMSLFALKYRFTVMRLLGWGGKLRAWLRGLDDARLFSLLSIVVVFVFYCIPKSKRSVYLLPVYPFVAFFLSEYIIYIIRNHRAVVRTFGYIMSVVAVLLPSAYLSLHFFGATTASESLHSFAVALADAPVGVLNAAAILLPVAGAVLFFVLRHRPGMTPVYSVIAVVFSVFMSLDGFYLPTILSSKSDRGVAMKIKEIAPEGQVYSYRTDILPGDRMHPFTINFYLGGRVVPFESTMPAKGYLIAGDNDIGTFIKTYPEYSVGEVVDFKHKSCDDGKYLHLYRFDRK